MHDRKTIQTLYIRICRDSNYSMPYEKASLLTGKVLNCDPLEVWIAFGSIDMMMRIADGSFKPVETTNEKA